jgi:hypothetical protein
LFLLSSISVSFPFDHIHRTLISFAYAFFPALISSVHIFIISLLLHIFQYSV